MEGSWCSARHKKSASKHLVEGAQQDPNLRCPCQTEHQLYTALFLPCSSSLPCLPLRCAEGAMAKESSMHAVIGVTSQLVLEVASTPGWLL